MTEKRNPTHHGDLNYGHFRSAWTAEQEECFSRVERRADEVFGNRIDAAVWMAKNDPEVGETWPISELIKTPEGAAKALAVLDRLALTVVPRPGPDFDKIRRARRRR